MCFEQSGDSVQSVADLNAQVLNWQEVYVVPMQKCIVMGPSGVKYATNACLAQVSFSDWHKHRMVADHFLSLRFPKLFSRSPLSSQPCSVLDPSPRCSAATRGSGLHWCHGGGSNDDVGESCIGHGCASCSREVGNVVSTQGAVSRDDPGHALVSATDRGYSQLRVSIPTVRDC